MDSVGGNSIVDKTRGSREGEYRMAKLAELKKIAHGIAEQFGPS